MPSFTWLFLLVEICNILYYNFHFLSLLIIRNLLVLLYDFTVQLDKNQKIIKKY